MSRTLVLNGDFRAIGVTDSRRALVLVLKEKAEVLEESNTYFHAERLAFALPLVIRLVKTVKVPFVRRLPVTRRMVLARDGHICAYCEGHADTVDHIVPRSKGGRHAWLNVIAACKKCNSRKDDHSLEESGMKLRFKPTEPAGTIAFLVVVGSVEESWTRWIPA